MSTESKKRVITLTDRPPVRINEDDWPVVAIGVYSDHDNQYEFQANRKWDATLRVRQHADGRAIVSGYYSYDTRFQGENDFVVKAGVKLDKGEDWVSAIKTVASTLRDACEEAERSEFCKHISAAERDCIADLPAEDI